MNTQNIFVYGSLRSGFNHPAYDYLSKYFKLIGNAKAQGILYDNGEYPVARPTGEEKFIIGELYQINNAHEFSYVIGQLDDYEGVNVEQGEMALYKRDGVIANCNGQQFDAWIYWFNGSVDGMPEIPSGDVLEYFKKK